MQTIVNGISLICLATRFTGHALPGQPSRFRRFIPQCALTPSPAAMEPLSKAPAGVGIRYCLGGECVVSPRQDTGSLGTSHDTFRRHGFCRCARCILGLIDPFNCCCQGSGHAQYLKTRVDPSQLNESARITKALVE